MFLSFVLQLAFLLSSLLIKILLDLLGHDDLISENFLFPFSQISVAFLFFPEQFIGFLFKFFFYYEKLQTHEKRLYLIKSHIPITLFNNILPYLLHLIFC